MQAGLLPLAPPTGIRAVMGIGMLAYSSLEGCITSVFGVSAEKKMRRLTQAGTSQ